ncbi:MAG: hypothetical protein ACTSXL_02565 [Alphaproteobacteria bacterium]
MRRVCFWFDTTDGSPCGVLKDFFRPVVIFTFFRHPYLHSESV